MPVRTLYKYLSINSPDSWVYRRQLIAERELYFSDPGNFNDPLDCNIATAAKHRGMLHDCNVFCLSGELRDDILMFAHYGGHHRGFRLTFKVNTGQPIREAGVLTLGSDVEYVEGMPDFCRTNIHKSLLTKSSCWRYEAEYRIFAVNTKIITYDEEALVEVAFGFKMNPDFESVIRNWVKEGGHNNVKFLTAIPSTDNLGFEYVSAD